MTLSEFTVNEECLKHLIRARDALLTKLNDLSISSILQDFHYCLYHGVDPIGYDRPESILEVMQLINNKVSEAYQELSILEDNLTKRIKEISDDIEMYKSLQSNQYNKTNF